MQNVIERFEDGANRVLNLSAYGRIGQRDV